MNELLKKVDNFYIENNLEKSKVLVAFSGGADSSSLSFLLKEYLKGQIVLCYFAHFLRDSEIQLKEIQKIKEFCQKYDFDYEIVENKVNLKEEALRNGLSLEEHARNVRYAVLQEACKKHNAKYIALGHNKNDQYETLIMRVFQSSFLDGLKGIPSVNGNLIRPIMGIERFELENYLREKEVTYIEDHTNFENIYLRNKVRNILIPQIEEIFPSFKKSLDRLSFFSKDLLLYLSDIEYKKIGEYYVFELEKVIKNAKYLFYRTILKILFLEGVRKKYSYSFLEEIFKIPFEKKKNKILLEDEFFILEFKGEFLSLLIKRKLINLPENILIISNKVYNFGSLSFIFEGSFEFEFSLMSYAQKSKFFENKKKRKHFFQKFDKFCTYFLFLLVINEEIKGLVDFSEFKFLYKDKSLKGIEIRRV